MKTRQGPLADLTVLDLSRVVSGPYCTMLLADLGARVIKIEQPGKGDDTRSWGPPFRNGVSAYFLGVNRNKESVALDFKHPEGLRILRALVARADVVVENFRPGKLAKVGLDYETLSAQHPRLIYCSVSGFGQTGRRAAEPGYDAVVQAEGGFMSVTGMPDGPPLRPGLPVADLAAGLFAASGILMALYHRERSGVGQYVDVGMLDSVVALLTYQASSYFMTGQVPVRTGNRHAIVTPYETFAASDGDFVLAVGNDEQFSHFCRAAGLEHLLERFATNDARVHGYAELRPIIADRLRTETRQYWIDRLSQAGVPCGSVRTLDEVFADGQLTDREMVVSGNHPLAGPVRLLGVPIKMSQTPGAVYSMPPVLGEHTDSVLRETLAMRDAEIARLRRDGVIG